MPWQSGEPNNGDVEKSAEIELRSSDWSNFSWNDRPLDYEIQKSWYICQKPAQPPPVEGECPSGWKQFQSKCYYSGTNRISWLDADSYCKDQGGQLAKDTSDVHSFLSTEVANLDTSGCSPIWFCNLYVGLVYRPGEGYKWSDGSAVDESFMPWQSGEPNDGDVEKSAEIELRSSDWSNFSWNDRPLDYEIQKSWYICQKEASTPEPPPTQAPPPPPTEAPPPPKTERPKTAAPQEPQTTNIPTLPPCEYPVPIHNVAEGRPTHQSSDKPKKDGGSEKAVDGNKDSDLKKGNSCTWTNKEYQPYWQVDLGQTYDIYEVVITNRQDCCSHRIKNAQIRVGDSQNFEENPVCGTMIIGKMSREETITIRCGCETPMKGQYVSIQLIDKEQMLHLCEVEVMAG
ncbi:uncharacterized protein [Ptychodera flava]|uniref:uncharacterized protein n=1 Tax=Ptychodera flava TaxID=63121 RepID=UPI00396A23BC